MANKPVLKFSGVSYSVGPTGAQSTGYRPQLEPQQSVEDLAFANEIVAKYRLSAGANEVLHILRCAIKGGLELVCGDGRPRGITDETGMALLKFNRFANGNLASPTSAWNDTCKAYVKAQILANAKEIDASFQNVDSGVGVKLDNVTWVGAEEVINVIKVGQSFAAYGRNMQMLTGDTAKLILPDLTEKALTCTSSDVAHAVFSWPTSWTPEAGTRVTFVMRSRGGVAEGEVYTSTKKDIAIIAA